MQDRVPNQYKPSFFENLFSAFIPVPTRRILSDKKLEKQKKINLSITDDNKSKKKLKISKSFQKKATPSTNCHKNNNDNNVEQQSLKRKQENNKNKGLNFHPRKINFQHQHTLKPKKQSQCNFTPSPNISFANDLSASNSRTLLLLDRKENTKQRTSEKPISQSYTIKNRSPNQSFDNESKKKQLGKQFPNFFNQKNETYPLAHETKNKNLNAQFTKSCDKYVDGFSIFHKYNVESNLRNQRKKQFDESQYLLRQRSDLDSIPHSFLKESFEQRSTLEKQQNQRNFPTVQDKETLKAKQKTLETPKSDKNIFIKPIKILTENSESQRDTIQNQLNESKFITNLYDKVRTIQSKNDESSQRSGSDCYSNVIERITGQEMLGWRNTNRDFIEEPRQWDEIRRKSLYSNLMRKFEQNNQQVKQSEQVRSMNFKKKNGTKQENSLRNWKQKQNDENLSKMEQKILDSKLSFSPPSFPEKKKLDCNKMTLRINSDCNSQFQSPYTFFTKITYLGVGRFASVYFCLDSSINFIFAIKQILKFTVKYNKIESQLRKQVEIQHSCSHPNILNLYNIWSDQKRYYLALQYGQTTLLKVIQSSSGQGLKQQQCLHYLKQIITGLEYLHAKRIIHRDIKPENIMIVNGCCKIGDFGWATQIQINGLTEPCGTPCYISPQIQNMETYTEKTDIWSVGILAYELINGRLDENCFGSGLNTNSLDFKGKVSKQYKKMVQILLSKKQEDRPTASEILNFTIFKQK